MPEARGVMADGRWWTWSRAEDVRSSVARGRVHRYQKGLFVGCLIIVLLLMGLAAACFLLAGIGSYGVFASLAPVALSGAAFFGCATWYRLQLYAPSPPPLPSSIDAPTFLPRPGGVLAASVESCAHHEVHTLMTHAAAIARTFQHAPIETIHLLAAGMATRDGGNVFGRLGLSASDLAEVINRKLNEQPAQALAPEGELSTGAIEALVQAFVYAVQHHETSVRVADVLLSAAERDEWFQEVLTEKGISLSQFAHVVSWIRTEARLIERYHTFRRAAFFKPTGPMNRSMTAVATPFLDHASQDITALSARGRLPMLIGKEKELQDIFRVLEATGRSVLLVGEEGIGKMSLLFGVAERMVEESVPKRLQDKRLLLVSFTQLLSGVGASEAEQRLLRLFQDVVRSRNIVLAVGDVHSLASLENGSSLITLLADLIERTGVLVLATTTPAGHVASIEPSPLARLFEVMSLAEPSVDESIRILEAKVPTFEYTSGALFSYAALEACVTLTHRYMHERYLPEKAIVLAQEVALDTARTKGKGALITASSVEQIITQKTHIPLSTPTREEPDLLLRLEERLHERMVGQEEAVKAVASAIRRSRTALNSSTRPIATFLFLGPTGVGKTELAKALASVYFGSETSMIRFDMSEFQDVGGSIRLLGDVASQTQGRLTEALRKQPFALVLLDEFEKTHPNVLNLFLQIFDDGRVTDASGRVIDCTNALFIATSNAGAEYIQKAIASGEASAHIKTALLEGELSGTFKPELLNRFDGVVVFTTLTQENVEHIARLLIQRLTKQLEEKGIIFEASDEAIRDLAKRGYDPRYGARPLRRLLQEEVDDAIAKALLGGRVKRRDTIVLGKGGVIDIREATRL